MIEVRRIDNSIFKRLFLSVLSPSCLLTFFAVNHIQLCHRLPVTHYFSEFHMHPKQFVSNNNSDPDNN